LSKVEASGSWQTAKSEEQVEAIVHRFAAENKMKVDDSAEAEGINLRGGSQVAMRTLGGWFVKPTTLPKRATVSVSETAQGASVDATIEDSMGIGVMDPKLRKKYESYCEAWIAGLGKELEA
jgi:hypothetical protein